MSLWSKAKKLVNKAAKYLPAVAQVIPSSKGLATAAGTLQQVGAVLQGGAIPLPGSIPGFGGAIPLPMPSSLPAIVSTPKALPMSIAPTSSLPAFPGGGGIVKTGLPVAAAIAGGAAIVRSQAPRLLAAGRALLPKVNKKVAAALGWATVGGLAVDAAGQVQGRVGGRRMNPLNPKAARRAIRRVKAVRKLCTKLESALPKRKCTHAHAHRHR